MLVYQRSTFGGHTKRGNLQIVIAFATYGQVYPHLVYNPLDVAIADKIGVAHEPLRFDEASLNVVKKYLHHL
jgi:hypothetical protein